MEKIVLKDFLPTMTTDHHGHFDIQYLINNSLAYVRFAKAYNYPTT